MSTYQKLPASTRRLIEPGSRVRTLILTCFAALIVFVCLGGFFLLGGVGLSTIFGEPDLEVSVSTPQTVRVGETFIINVNITNADIETLTISEVRVPKLLLEGAILTGTLPLSSATYDYAGQVGYAIPLVINPTQTSTISLFFTALRQGDYGGDIGVLVGRRSKSAPFRMQIFP